ncbi:MAG TPA: glucosidase, partial [Pseudolabrys sp.]|nr:glucosidase [Pseudolabrys sp.]
MAGTTGPKGKTAEHRRLAEADCGTAKWRRWGPYLSERQWGTVREDYSRDGNAWSNFPYEQARSRAYRWGEDGIAGVSDDQQRLCLALALWNERDPTLKERLFGLTGPEGNHGEDVKEYYYYLDATPTHAYLKILYKYPQGEYPYAELRNRNPSWNKLAPEFELIDTGLFDEDRYFDVFVEYAKASPDDILMVITAHNRGPDAAPLHILPTLWFRNTWSWKSGAPKPSITRLDGACLEAKHAKLGTFRLYCDGSPKLLFCENETNFRKLYGSNQAEGYFKDGINDFVVAGDASAVNPQGVGSKAAAHYRAEIPGGGSATFRLRLSNVELARPFYDADAILVQARQDADDYYADLQHDLTDADARRVQRQGFAGMIWTKQFYYYDVPEWLNGDPTQPAPPPERRHGRNADWDHVNNADVLSMPDKWEYPWFAAWDLAFHCLPLALLDPAFAKEQLVLLTREWYSHPNGQL